MDGQPVIRQPTPQESNRKRRNHSISNNGATDILTKRNVIILFVIIAIVVLIIAFSVLIYYMNYEQFRRANAKNIVIPPKCFAAQQWHNWDHSQEQWTKIQHRTTPYKLNFHRNWKEYKHGFREGDEMWKGLEEIHKLTKHGLWSLRIEVRHEKGPMAWVEYPCFGVSNEEDGYRLHIDGEAIGPMDDVLRCQHRSNGQMPANMARFTTYDRDNDLKKDENCAMSLYGGWWHSDCGTFQPNTDRQYGNGYYYHKCEAPWIVYENSTLLMRKYG